MSGQKNQTPGSPAAFWDERYREPGFSFGEAPNAWLAAQRSSFTIGQRALVPGDGEGRNGVWLAELGLSVTTIDASPIGVHKANLLAAERGVTLDAQVADLTTWPWPTEAFDVVATIYLHFPSAIRRDMHRRMLQSLKPGGLLILEGYSRRQLVFRASGSVGGVEGPSDPDLLFDPAEIVADFDGLAFEHFEEERVTLDEGKRHRGPSAVVRMKGRRP
jgi:hypothetical protein